MTPRTPPAAGSPTPSPGWSRHAPPEGLAFPDVEPTVVDDPAVPVRHPGRRRLLLAGGAILLTGGGTGAAVWASGDDGKPAAGPARPVYVLGVHTTSGTAEAPVSRASERAARPRRRRAQRHAEAFLRPGG
ncbi:hypothetical protein ACRAWF_32750 [Streptomyces sp. L7]